MCVYTEISSAEAHELWIRSGRDAWLFVQFERAAQQAGLQLSWARQGDHLIVDSNVYVTPETTPR